MLECSGNVCHMQPLEMGFLALHNSPKTPPGVGVSGAHCPPEWQCVTDAPSVSDAPWCWALFPLGHYVGRAARNILVQVLA